MNIITLNCGSSSIKAELIDAVTGERRAVGTVERLPDAPQLTINDQPSEALNERGHRAALAVLLERLNVGDDLAGVGHRVVHGGQDFDRPVRIDGAVKERIAALAELAPLHNPINLAGIEQAQAAYPDVPHVAVFDTAFHHTLPKRAATYALPQELNEKYRLRRYGFHGTSHEYVAGLVAETMNRDLRELRIITCHLGSGCSVAAIEYGRSVETSMGMTPLEGLVVSTRSGDLDPGLLFYLAEREGWSWEDANRILNKESGLSGLSGTGGDLRDILDRAAEGDEGARLAMQVFAHRVKKYIGAYTAVMGGADAIVFTGGIGENSYVIRNRVMSRLDHMGAILSEDRNHAVALSHEHPIAEISMNHSRARIFAARTDEQFAIARKTAKLIAARNQVNSLPSIPVAVSARHMHITQETLEQLFGEGYQLTVKKPLSQPGQFAANETVTIVGPKNRIERVRILGPVRPYNQIEISRTDEFFLGVDAPVRESGKVDNSPGCRVIGPAGEVTLQSGLICAWRHIHMTPEDAVLFGVQDRDIVEIRIEQGDRSLTFGNVLIRVSPSYVLEMHIDTDEGNAAEITPGATGVLTQASEEATMTRRRLR